MSGSQVALPYTFSNATTAFADQVNGNFAEIAAKFNAVVNDDGTLVLTKNSQPVTMTTGGTPKYVVAALSESGGFDQYGNLLAGQNKLISSTTPGTEHAEVPDFIFWANSKRLGVRNISLAEIDDPSDISGRRFGPSGGYPNAAPSNGDGTYASLTGLDAGACIFQVRAAPGVVPFGGTSATAGATAPVNNSTIGFYTTEMARDLTGFGDYALGSAIKFSTTAIGRASADDLIQFTRVVKLGRTAIADNTDRGLLYVRGDAGANDQQQIAVSGSVTGGTFTLTHYGTGLVPPGQTTAGIAYNATATDVKNALEALGTIGVGQLTATGGPLPGTPVVITFSGASVKHTNFTKLHLASSLTGGGTFAVTKQQDGIPDGLGTPLLYLRHGGGGGDTPTANYVQIVDPSGNDLLTVDQSKILTVLGDGARFVVKKSSDATQPAFTSLVTGDSQERFILRANGRMEWGPGGSTATDTILARSGAAALSLTGALTVSEGLTIADGKDITIATGTGSKIGQAASKIGFFGVSPVAKPAALTQTYATADGTLATPTSAALSVSVGTSDGTVADVGAAFSQTTLNNNFRDVSDAYNALRTDHLDLAQFVNQLVDALQSLGLVG